MKTTKKLKQIKLPKSFKPWFWEYDFSSLNTQGDWKLIIDRLLEKGKVEQVKWVFSNYSRSVIKERVKESPNLSQQTKIFWEMYFNETA